MYQPDRPSHRIRRRELLPLIGGAAMSWPLAARAQQKASRMPRIGYLGTGTAAPVLLDTFRGGLREAGWVVGDSILFEERHAEGQYDRLHALAAELVRLPSDVIVASPTTATLAARKATEIIPIIGIGMDNPVQIGLVASLSHPGGNVTGLSYSVGPEIFGKDLELLKLLMPDLRRIAILSNSAGPTHITMITSISAAASLLGLDLVVLDAQKPTEIEATFANMLEQRAEALFVFGDPLFSVRRAWLAGLAVQHRLPTMYTQRLHVEAGGLMSYGPSFTEMWRRAAGYVDNILKGAKPADLPVQQPTKFELVINLKTAKALGVTVPQALLARADQVIE